MDRDILLVVLGAGLSHIGLAIKYYFDWKAERDRRAWDAKQELRKEFRDKIENIYSKLSSEQGLAMFGREMTVLELELAKTNAVERLMEMV